jgi:hypothetical protein
MKKQLRRSISLAPGRFEELQLLAGKAGLSKAAWLEQKIGEAARAEGLEVDPVAARERANERYTTMRERKLADVERRRVEAFG